MANLSFSLMPILAALPWEAGYWFPPQRSTYAADLDWVYFFIGWVSIFFFVVIMAIMTYFCIVYRKRPGQPKYKVPTHHSGLEIAWSILPSFLLVYMFYAGFTNFMDMRSMPDEAYNIVVTGQKWFWSFSYDNGKVVEAGAVANDADWNNKESIFKKVPRLHVPVNTDIVLTMNAKDVLHSFFIPAFRTKQDVVPGRYTKLWFQATDVGVYDVFCAEYCGDKHSEMLAEVVVESQEDFDKWYAVASNLVIRFPDPVKRGEYLYNSRGCTQCHSLDGTSKPTGGPSFLGGWGKPVPVDGQADVPKMDENYVRESILNPLAKVHKGFGKIMPAGLLTKDEEIDAIVTFIRALNEPKSTKTEETKTETK